MPVFKPADAIDIGWICDVFADGAARAVEAGFDAIELHAGHTYLINSFLSPAHNRRNDGYGGAVEGRARLMKEVIEAIRARIGRTFPLQVKLNAEEYHFASNITLEDAKVAARIAAEAGTDAITQLCGDRRDPVLVDAAQAEPAAAARRCDPQGRRRSGHHGRPRRSGDGRPGDCRRRARLPRPAPLRAKRPRSLPTRS